MELVEEHKFEKISLNNYDCIEEIDGEYFHSLIPLKLNMKNSKSIYNITENTNKTGTYYIYSFSLNPTEFQPSGSCNFSRIHNAFLQFDNITSDKTDLLVFATNYNILYIESGMGGLAYSN